MRRTVWRYAFVVAGLVLVVGGLAGIKFAQILKLVAFGKQMQANGPPPESVSSALAQAQTWERTIRAVGTVTGIQSTDIRNELSGIVRRIEFNSGAKVPKGALLVEIDSRLERSQLDAAKARREQSRVNLERAKTQEQGGVLAPAAREDAKTALDVAQSEVGALEARLAQKLIRAPFAGKLGIREVSVGQFLNPGTRVTVLDSADDVFVDFTLPQEDQGKVVAGVPVRVAFTASPKTIFTAEVVAADPTVDPVTRNLTYRARLSNQEGRLRPGMFVEVTVVSPQKMNVVAVPGTAVIHAPYGDSVFVIEPKRPGTPGLDRSPDGRPIKIARQQFVRLGTVRGDFVQIEQGLRPNAEVVASGSFKLRNGSPVVVQPSSAPKPSLNPTPENQ